VATIASASDGRDPLTSASAMNRNTNGTRANVMALTMSKACLRFRTGVVLPFMPPLYTKARALSAGESRK